MSIDNIEAFLYVHHFGSINQAAKALFLTQPTVTARIQSLERELDVALFDRVGRRLVMTEEARDFLPYAESIVEAYQNGKSHLEKRSKMRELVIGCNVLASYYLLPEVLSSFRKENPSIKIRTVTSTSEEIERQVMSGSVDIGFVRSSKNPVIVSKKVLESPIHFYVEAESGFKDGEVVDFEDLAKEPIVFYECDSLDWALVKKLFRHLKYFPNIAYEVDSLEQAKALIMNRSGVGFLPEISVRKELTSKLVRRIHLPFSVDASLKIDMIYLKGKKSPYVPDFEKLFYAQT